MTTTPECGYVIVTDYVVQNYCNGKSSGVPQYFSSLSEVKYYMSDSRGNMPQMRIINGNENVPERERDGLICEERRWKKTPLDSNPQGTRVFA